MCATSGQSPHQPGQRSGLMRLVAHEHLASPRLVAAGVHGSPSLCFPSRQPYEG